MGQNTMSEPRTQGNTRTFDGVICFGGEDWWYHNRAHYDMQMMRELSAHVPVLYVNSIGMRVPTPGGEGGMFLRRVTRKLKSFSRGLVRVRDRFAVQSPVVVPGKWGMKISGSLLPRQVRRAARKLGIERPLVWIACPPGVEALDGLGDLAGLVYQRTDRFEAYEGVDGALIGSFDEALKGRADLTLYCSRHLYEAERGASRASAFVDHGVDFEDFVRAGDDPGARTTAAPEGIRAIAGPRAGFVGDIDSAVFDHEFLLAVARLAPDVQFVLVGGCTLPEGWADAAPNVHLTGRVPYEEVMRTMAAMDVLLMPWHRSEWIKPATPSSSRSTSRRRGRSCRRTSRSCVHTQGSWTSPTMPRLSRKRYSGRSQSQRALVSSAGERTSRKRAGAPARTAYLKNSAA